MASPRWSTSMLLASLILLYWTTSSAWSHSSTDRSALYRAKRALPPGSKENIEKALEIAKSSLSVFKDVMEDKNLKGMLQNLATFASLAPGIGTLISAVINMALVFIPQTDPVLNKLDKGFAEVNMKLDSLFTKMSDLTTDVEWNSYASMYSQDEACILNAWKKFSQVEKAGFKNFKSVAEKDKDFYKSYKCTDNSVENLYRYLTVKDVSLTKNLNDLLKKKFKCDLNVILKYNFYLNSLLWKGILLKDIYWTLKGSKTSSSDAEHAKMLKDVSDQQQEVVEYCLNNNQKYVRNDVEEIAKKYNPDQKKEIAYFVKTFLDKKYSWYNWVVLVYDPKQEKAGKIKAQKLYVYNMDKLTIGNIVVAVTHLKSVSDKNKKNDDVTKMVDKCFPRKAECNNKCNLDPWGRDIEAMQLTNFAKVTIADNGEAKFEEFPQPLNRKECTVGGNTYKVSVHVSRKLPVSERDVCKNNGRFKRLMDSNEWLCICQGDYYGDRCDKKMNLKMP